jgi:hypothetical protein
LHLAERLVADAQAPGRCALLHARGQVHARPGQVERAGGADANERRSGVQAGPHVERAERIAASQRIRPGTGVVQDREAREHPGLDVVLACRLAAEDGQQAVARVLHDPAAVSAHRRGETAEGGREHVVHRLRIEPLAHRRRTDGVDEQDGQRSKSSPDSARIAAIRSRNAAMAGPTTASPSAPRCASSAATACSNALRSCVIDPV